MLSQIQPHSLYNSLNTIYGLCEKDPPAAKKAVNDFADYLRGNMDSLSRKSPVPFETELKLLKAYLSLEQTRFKKKLNIVWDIQTDSFMIPALTVQPLAENAVKHGICKAEKGGTVKISSRELEDCFEVEVSDNGAVLEITSETGKGTSAVIRLPKQSSDGQDIRNIKKGE